MTEPFIELTDAIEQLSSGKSLYSECEQYCIMVQRTKNGEYQALILDRENNKPPRWQIGQMNDAQLITWMVERSDRWKTEVRNKPVYLGDD